MASVSKERKERRSLFVHWISLSDTQYLDFVVVGALVCSMRRVVSLINALETSFQAR